MLERPLLDWLDGLLLAETVFQQSNLRPPHC
jgi:hypothetical protein